MVLYCILVRCIALQYIVLWSPLCTVAPGRVVCHAWSVFWHPVTSSHLHLVSCYIACHKQACFVVVSGSSLHYIVLVLHCIAGSYHVLLGRVVSWPLFSCHVCPKPGPWHLEKHAQSMLKPSKKENCIVLLHYGGIFRVLLLVFIR